MRLAILADLHWGVRNDSPVFLEHFRKFYDEQFFPYLDAHNIDSVVILGDFWDRRKYCNIATLNFVRKHFIDKFREKRLHGYILAGNHDVYHTNTLEVNSLEELIPDVNRRNFTIILKPYEEYFDPCGLILFIPWICASNEQECLEALDKTEAKICFGHFEIKGFEMHVGQPTTSGLDRLCFDKFDTVLSGHLHVKATKDNVSYLGPPSEMTWNDYGTPHGFHVFDTVTQELTHIPNPVKVFHKLVYDDYNKELTDIMDWDFSKFQNSYIKVIVKTKTNSYWFDMFVAELEKHAIDVKIVEDVLETKSRTEIIGDAEDTITILRKVVAEANLSVDKERLDSFLVGLYTEALTMEA